MSTANCTYFEYTGTTQGSGACTHKICPVTDNICRIRLDFQKFVISGPSTDSTSVVKLLNGIVAAKGDGASTTTQCLTDTFTISNQPNGVPVICGDNTGQHGQNYNLLPHHSIMIICNLFSLQCITKWTVENAMI